MFQHLEEKQWLHMDRRMRGSLTTTEKLFDFCTIAFEAARWINVVLISYSVWTFRKCSSRTQRQRKTITNLLCQQGSARRKDTIQPIGKTSFGSHHRCSEAQTLFPKLLHHCLDIHPIEQHFAQTRTLRTADEMGGTVKTRLCRTRLILLFIKPWLNFSKISK